MNEKKNAKVIENYITFDTVQHDQGAAIRNLTTDLRQCKNLCYVGQFHQDDYWQDS